MVGLIVTELIVPVLRSTELIFVQIASGLYFCGLAWLCRTRRAATWPAQCCLSCLEQRQA